MADQILKEVKVNGIDVSAYVLKWQAEETFGDVVRDCKIELSRTAKTLLTFENGQSLTIKRGFTTATDQFVFNGYVDVINEGSTNVILMGKCKMADLVRRNVTYTYNGTSFPSTEAKGSDIVKDLIETWGGMTAEVVDTGTTNVLDKYICSGTDILTRIQEIAGIYDYQIYYDSADDKVHFEPKGYNASSEILYIGGTNSNVKNVPNWILDLGQCINKVTVKGAVQEVQDEQYFNGDASANQTFLLPKKPKIVQCWEDIAGTFILKVAGVINSTSGTFDFLTDKETKTITCTDNWTPASGSNNVKIVYTNNIPVPVTRQDTPSQTTYGIYDVEKYFSDIQSVEDAKQRARGLITRYKDPFLTSVIKPIRLIDYEAGQTVQVIDNINDKNISVVISKIIKKWPHTGDEIAVGDKESRISDWGKFTMERIRRLEEEYQRDTDFVIQAYEFGNPIDLNLKYVRARKKNLIASGGIYGHPDPAYGAYGTAVYGDPFDAGTEVLRVVWPEDTYTESFKTTDFEGTGDAIWSLITNSLQL